MPSRHPWRRHHVNETWNLCIYCDTHKPPERMVTTNQCQRCRIARDKRRERDIKFLEDNAARTNQERIHD